MTEHPSQMTNEDIARARSDLPFLQDIVYVDNAATSPVPLSVQNATNAFTELTVRRLRDVTALSEAEFNRGRRLAARLVGSIEQRIAYIENTSHGLSLVAMGLDWKAGDNVVLGAQEFPSNFLCWLQLEALGVQVRRVDSRGGRLETSDFASLVDARTRVVSVSQVQFYSGFRMDLAPLAELAHAHGALLVVDGTQSVGAIAIDMAVIGVDVLVVSAHKWMLGPRGIGFIAFSDRALERVTPRIVGWLTVNEPFAFKRTLDYLPDARRFEPGTPNGAGIYGLTERLSQIVELGVDRIEARVLLLNQTLQERSKEAGLQVVFEFDDTERSGILLVRRPWVATERLLDRLNQENIHACIRSDAIRLSPHYYATDEEIERIVSTLSSTD